MVPAPAQGRMPGKASRSTPLPAGTSARRPTGTSPNASPTRPRPRPPRAAPKPGSSWTPYRAPVVDPDLRLARHPPAVGAGPSPAGSTPTRPPTRPRRRQPGWTEPGVAKPSWPTPSTPGTWSTAAPARPRQDRSPGPSRPDQWIWSPEPTHPAIIDRPTWDAAQKIGAERGNVRDAETPTTRPGRRYILRSRIRHHACQRRMCGIAGAPQQDHRRAPTPTTTAPTTPPTPATPPPTPTTRHVGRPSARTPSWPPSPRFFDQHVFGHDRAALLAAQLPATDAEQPPARDRQHAHLTAELARIDTAERGLISELEHPGRPGRPRHPGLPGPHPRPLRRTVRRAHPHRSPARQTSRPPPPPTTTRPCSTLPHSPPPCSPTPPTGSKKPCSPRSTSRPSTATTKTRSPSGPPSPTTPPAPSPPCSATPATDSQPGPQPSAQADTPVPNSELAQGPIWP